MLAFSKISGDGKKSNSKMVPGGNPSSKMKRNTTTKAQSAQKAVSQPTAVNNFGTYTKSHGHKGRP